MVPVLIPVSLLAIWCGTTISLMTDDGDNVPCPNPRPQVAVSIDVNDSVETMGIAGSLLADDVSLPSQPESFQFEHNLPSDPFWEEQWALRQIEAAKLWQITTGNPQILVAVLDTGIDKHHEDLNGKVVAELNFTDSPTASDIYGHGTHIAGIITAERDNGLGIVGMAPGCRLLNIKVANDEGRCDISAVAKGITWAVDNGAKVINVSIQLAKSSPALEDAVNYAWSKGALIIAAAGNNSDGPVYPAYCENCIAVTAIRQDGTLVPLSNHGDWVDVAAPGFNIYSTLPQNAYGYKSGSSFATAYVSGLATLLFNIAIDNNNDGRLNDEVRTAIEAGCREIGTDGTGKGRIDAAKSLAELHVNHVLVVSQ